MHKPELIGHLRLILSHAEELERMLEDERRPGGRVAAFTGIEHVDRIRNAATALAAAHGVYVEVMAPVDL